jgi:hypothetical protein
MDNNDDGDDVPRGLRIYLSLSGFYLIAYSVCMILPLLNLFKLRRMEKIGVPTVFEVKSARSGFSRHMFVSKAAYYVTVILVPSTETTSSKEKEYVVGKEEYDEALSAGQITMLVDSCTGFAYPEKTVLTQGMYAEASLIGQKEINTATYHRASGRVVCLYVMRNVVCFVVFGVSGFFTLIHNVLLLVSSPMETWLVASATVGGILVVVAALMWLLIHWDATFVRLFPHLGNDLDARPQQQQELSMASSSPSPDAYCRMPRIV